MNIPNNCQECKHSNECKGPHYGGSYCKFQEEINERTVAQILKTDK